MAKNSSASNSPAPRPDRRRVPTSRQRAGAGRQVLPQLVVPTPPGQEKYSAVLVRFAEPLLDETITNLELFRVAISLAVAVWNLTLLPVTEHEVILQTMLKAIPLLQRTQVKSMLDMLVKRKLTLFAAYHWRIQSYDVREDEYGGYFVKVLVEEP